MNILQLAKKVPYPPNDGEAIAIRSLTNGLIRAGHSVSLLAMATNKHPAPTSPLPETEALQYFETVFIDTSVRASGALWNLILHRSYNIARFVAEPFRQKLIALLQQQQFDVVQLEGLYLTPYIADIRQHSNALIAMRAHNVESEIWQRLAEERYRTPLKKAYLRLLARQMHRYESSVLNDFDVILPISSRDAKHFEQMGCQKPSFVLPFGVQIDQYLPLSTPLPPTLFFIGSMDWLPNLQGMRWFLAEVWTSLRQRFPSLQCYIAGRHMQHSDWPHPLPEGIILVGEVSNAKQFMQQHTLMVVPLFSGSGMRIKIIEAMALQKNVVATALAAEGIDYTHSENIWIANDTTTFIETISYCLNNPNKITQVGQAARQLVASHYDENTLIAQLGALYEYEIRRIAYKN